MSQSGKVLRLYVEVRSSPEHDLKSSSERNLDGPVEALKKFAEEATSADACRALRPNVSFQLQPSGNSLASPQRCAVQPQEPLEKPSSGLENKFSSHRTPGWVSERRMACRACSQTTKAELRQKSVVTFSYIEKPQIKTVKSPCSSPSITCQALACSHQKYSDPICSRLAANRSPKDQHKGFPAFSPSTYNLTGQLATQRALKEFGSPQLRCRFSQTPNRSPEFCQQQRARCQSWEGSQMPTYYSCRHDSSCCSTSNALPGFRSQACPIQQLYSAGDGQNWESEKTCLTKSSTPGLNQLSGSNASSALNSPEVARKIAEEASKVSAIFNEARIMSPLSGSPQKIHHGSPSEEKHEGCSVQLNIPVHELQLTQKSPSNLVSLPTNHGCALPEDLIHHPITSVLSRESCTSPALPSRFIRPSQSKADVCSPLRDPRQLRADLPVTESPTLHRHKPPQYTGEEWTSGEPCFLDEEDWDSQVAVDSAEISRRLFIGQSLSDSPVSWTSRQQWKEEANVTEVNFTLPERHKETLKISSLIDQEDETVTERNTRNLIDSVLDVNQSIANKEDEVTLQQKQAEWRRRQALLLGPVVLDEDQGFGENQGLSGTSPSSSGVTGSLGDRDCLSPEFSHQSDHPSSETQQDGGFLVPSLHCQKIARAKWEFLFGPSVENSASVWEKTPQSVCSTVDSSMLQTVKELRPRANQHVQHIEVELGTRPPVDQGKSGKISQTLKYSETNLDTVPRRCYCETNIDEVLLTEQEDADSAFGSNRSVMGSSPMGEVQSERTDKVEEEEEEEDVASWITVRMQGDMRRLRDEEPEFYREMLRSSKHTALKSPVLVRGPSRRSRDSLDTFSRHFENIVESFRAKGTSYSSLDSLDPLTVLTFDLPTLSPRERPAPLARVEVPSTSESALTFTADTDATRAPSSERLSSGSDERNGQSWHSGLSRPLHREEAVADIGCVDQVMMEVQDVSGNDALSHRGDLDAAKRLANRLFALDGFRKCDVARHLSKKKDFSRVVAEEYLQHFNFSDISLDQALRTFLTEFGLTGETQERETILSHFSRRFVQCNSCLTLSEDSVHTLTCALMLLNADLLDNKAVSLTHFSRSLEGLNSGRDFPKDLLKALYNSIKNEKLQWTIDEEELRKSFSELGDPRAEANCGGSPSALYKTGFLVRKVHADCDGKRTPRGKRGWKTFYAVLKGLVLYLRKGENRPDKQLSDEDLKNAVSIHHSLAIPATDYSKRPDVFYLRTADWRVYLFQAPNAEQMQSWITRINTVAAMFSTPPLHAAIGSQKKFSRPLLPGTASKLSQEEQVQAHESRFRSISSELTQLRSDPPERKVKGRDLEEYRMRAEYLEFEKTRCETYSMLLRAKQRCGDDSLSVFELMLVEEGALPQTTGSTPSLQDPQDIPANSNAQGQRHSYRQAVRK